ncbi:hypothetical protein PHK61_19235 [Actinomycetospora lutea]|uniref:hypothetical protein n=1 Tax=Actinomycetospora lutea TaxID=663604 RepID=UPI0023654E60|nr:hypothetical protein [Actinomycetospora lutea]MDD7940562.1 hypothetical protein [Actinomycetospora lutea]
MGGRRRRDGGRRAATVEARRQRRTRPPHTRATRAVEPRITAPLLSDCELIEQFPHAFDDDPDDELDLWVEDEEEDDEDDAPDLVDVLRERLREVVVATVEQRDPEVARAFVARGDRTLIEVVAGAWLAKARRRFPRADLAARAAAWVARTLGEAGPAVDDAARVLGPAAQEALREHFLRAPEDVVVARIWLLAAVVVVGGAGGDRWLDVLLLDEHR